MSCTQLSRAVTEALQNPAAQRKSQSPSASGGPPIGSLKETAVSQKLVGSRPKYLKVCVQHPVLVSRVETLQHCLYTGKAPLYIFGGTLLGAARATIPIIPYCGRYAHSGCLVLLEMLHMRMVLKTTSFRVS